MILKDNKTVFKATNQTGQPTVPLHATDGYMPIPVLNYKFIEKGKYLIKIPVNIIPIIECSEYIYKIL